MITFFTRRKCWSVFRCLTRQDVTPNIENTEAILKKKGNQILIQWENEKCLRVNQQFWNLFDSFLGNFDLNTLERANDISKNGKKEPDDRTFNLEVVLSEIKKALRENTIKLEQLTNTTSGSTDVPNTEFRDEKNCDVCSSLYINPH